MPTEPLERSGMRLQRFVYVTLLTAATWMTSQHASAEQRRDWMVAPQPGGT